MAPGELTLRCRPRKSFTRLNAWHGWLTTGGAGVAFGLAPFWWHLDLVDPRISGIIAVFAEVAVYPSDIGIAALAILAICRPATLRRESRWFMFGLTLLAAAALLSASHSLKPPLAGGLAAHLALLSLAWLGVRSGRTSRAMLVSALVVSAAMQSVVAVAQFIIQQPLIPSGLQLPWLPSDASQGGTPVVLNAAGNRLLRGFGTFPHPNLLGGYLAVALVSLPILGQRWPGRAPIWWSLAATISLGLVVSFSRGGWLAAIVGLSIWWWTRARATNAHRWYATVAAVALGAITISPVGPILAGRVLPFGPASNALERGSIENRLALDRSALLMLTDHLPMGVGGGNYGLVAVSEAYQEGWGEPAPNVALLIAAELGVPGMLALLVLTIGTVRMLRVGGRIDLSALGGCLTVVVLSMLDHYTWTMPVGRVIAFVPLAVVATSAARGPEHGSKCDERNVPTGFA